MEFWTHFLHNIRSKKFRFIQNKNMEYRFVKIWDFDLFTLWQTGNCLKTIWDHGSIKQRNIFSIQISLQVSILWDNGYENSDMLQAWTLCIYDHVCDNESPFNKRWVFTHFIFLGPSTCVPKCEWVAVTYFCARKFCSEMLVTTYGYGTDF